ncbi:MAG: hypothetical protein NTZ33_02945 [Bacteroidetes bacterium]|nr:hypothetical protein [Bacteroidota bacterium]
MKIRCILCFLIPVIYLFTGCTDDVEPEYIYDTGYLQVNFKHTVDNQPVQLNNNIYVNQAGNHYEIDDLLYFISDLTLISNSRGKVNIGLVTAVHLVNIKDTASLSWVIVDQIPIGAYDSVSFIFGLNEARNKTSAFVNPPESNMAWPDVLGGGYHYMMLNGKWINPQSISTPFNFHTGIGQIYTDTITYNTSTITAFVHNYFKVTLALNNFRIYNNSVSSVNLKMAIDSWFKTPHTWDHNYWGGSIMQKQRALKTIKENGFDVFSIQP